MELIWNYIKLTWVEYHKRNRQATEQRKEKDLNELILSRYRSEATRGTELKGWISYSPIQRRIRRKYILKYTRSLIAEDIKVKLIGRDYGGY